METLLVFTGIIAATVAVMYILVKLSMLFNRTGKDDETGQDVSSHRETEAETARK